MTEHLCKRVRRKAYFYLIPDSRPAAKECYGFKSIKSPPSIPELNLFEIKMKEMVQNIKFKKVNSAFLEQLRKDMRTRITGSDKLLIPTDKTSNFYRLDTNKCLELLNNKITKDYKKPPKKFQA